METSAFDDLGRSVGRWRSRRSVVKIAGTGALAAVFGFLQEPTPTDAKQRRVRSEHNIRGKKAIMCVDGKTVKVPKKKRKKYLNQGASRGTCKSCTPVCTPGVCGDDGCGGICGCVDGTICVSGACEACDIACTDDAPACGKDLNSVVARGGRIVICPGIYMGPFQLSQDVELIGSGSGDNPDTSTILIGAERAGAVISVKNVATATLASLRITGGNGTGQESGGIHVNNTEASVTLDNCALVGNTGYYGGGASVYKGILTISNSNISGNSAYAGGGIATDGTLAVETTTITNNTASTLGGGVFVNGGTTSLGSGVTITGNTSNGGAGTGGGIYKFTAGSTINNSATVTDNTPENCSGYSFTC